MLYLFVAAGLLIWFLNFRSNPVGIYVATYHQNTIDTIVILKGGTYKQSIYHKADRERLFHNEGEWSYKNGKIRFTNFFQGDDITRKSNFDYNSVLLTFSVPLETNFMGRPVFDYDQQATRHRYSKVFW